MCVYTDTKANSKYISVFIQAKEKAVLQEKILNQDTSNLKVCLNSSK